MKITALQAARQAVDCWVKAETEWLEVSNACLDLGNRVQAQIAIGHAREARARAQDALVRMHELEEKEKA